jgi:hypothetical protein
MPCKGKPEWSATGIYNKGINPLAVEEHKIKNTSYGQGGVYFSTLKNFSITPLHSRITAFFRKSS